MCFIGNTDKVVRHIMLIKALRPTLDRVVQVKVSYNYMLSWLIEKLWKVVDRRLLIYCPKSSWASRVDIMYMYYVVFGL